MRVEPSDDVIFQPLRDEIVLLNMKTQEYFALDDVGSDMWRSLLQHGDIQTVADALTLEYEVDRDKLWVDLNELVGRLLAAGLLKETNGTSLPLVAMDADNR